MQCSRRGVNTTVTPLPDGPNRDDLAYRANARDNRLPIPEPIVAGNGLNVESNAKHTPGAGGFRPNAGIEPRDSLGIFESSVSINSDKHRYAKDSKGCIHRYSPDNIGAYHWSGSTRDSNVRAGYLALFMKFPASILISPHKTGVG